MRVQPTVSGMTRSEHVTQHSSILKRIDETMIQTDAVPQAKVLISSTLYAEAVQPGSPDHVAARELQAARFARVSMPATKADAGDLSYVAVTDLPAGCSVPIVVKSTQVSSQYTGTHQQADHIVGSARLDLRGGMLIESLLRLAPCSISEHALASGKVGEISTFAAALDLDKALLPDILDGMAGVIVRLAADLGLEWLWTFPRSGFMSLVWAQIPGVMPGYRFTRNMDVTGWNEGNERLAQFRRLRLRGLAEYPEIYQISVSDIEADFTTRIHLRPKRALYAGQMEKILLHAMWQVRRGLGMSEHTSSEPLAALLQDPQASRTESTVQAADLPPAGGKSFLPFAAHEQSAADYLRQFLQAGGEDAADYKRRSYALLDVQPGMSVLDVGCGVGVDLGHLYTLVGDKGTVIGLDNNTELIRQARQSDAVRDHANVMVFQGDAHAMAFPPGSIDRLRADRTLQHCAEPGKVIAEMWRVLRPGGVMSLVEPDWKAIVVYPSSADGGNDDLPLARLIDWYARHVTHGMIGRQLRSLLAAPAGGWSNTRVDGVAYSLQSWQSFDAVLQVSRAVDALISEDPSCAALMQAWITALKTASAEQRFLAMTPMFFATATKSTIDR